MDESIIISDDPGEYEDPATEALLDKAFAFGDNLADVQEVRDRAEDTVIACLTQAEEGWSKQYSKFVKLEKLWEMESLSQAALDYDIHMGTPFQKTEELAGKLNGAMFGGGQKYVGGEVEYEDDKEKAGLTLDLIQEVLDTEVGIRRSALSDFREAGIFGLKVKKIVPDRRIEYRLEPKVESITMPDDTVKYKFTPPEETERWTTRLKGYDVSPFDFRIPPTAKNIRDADWMGDFSYPGRDEVEDRVTRGEYSKQAWDDYVGTEGQDGGHRQPQYSSARGRMRGGDQPDQSPTSTQFACFEWWGMFDIDGSGIRKACVVTILFPAENLSRQTPRGKGKGWVVRVARNPNVHQLPPYVAIKLFEKDNKFYTPGIMELVAKHSAYEDEFGLLALLQGQLEVTPPLEVSEDADVTDDQIDGFMAGKTIRVAEKGHLNYLTMPQTSGRGIQNLEYFSGKAIDVAGMGAPNNAPRTAAAGQVMQAQELDSRLTTYIEPIERGYLMEAALLGHAYVRQYFTNEKMIKTIGIAGNRARDFRTVRPTDVVAELRFEPVVGKRIVQKAMQGQQMINWWDRAAATNMQTGAQGRGEMFKMESMAETIFADVFGIMDYSKFMNPLADPMQLRTPAEEHKLFHMGELPGVQPGENFLVHFNGHMDFYDAGGTDSWKPERRQAFFDHLQKSSNMLMRQMTASMPDAGQMIEVLQQRLDSTGMTSTQPNQSANMQSPQQGGGRGVDPGGAVGSPMMRRPGLPGVPAMGMGAPNMGSQ
jgi:hypothetical protein